MTAEATLEKSADTIDITAPAALTSGEVRQFTDGRATFLAGLKNPASGEAATLNPSGSARVAKTTGVVCVKGSPAYWDISAGKTLPYRTVGTGDFPMGVYGEDAAASATDVAVRFNVLPHRLIDLHRDAFESLIVKTVVGSTTITIPEVVTRGGQTELKFGLTAEAQKVDLLSKNSVPVSVPFIAGGRVAIYDIGDNAALDLNIGIANATHATDGDAIAESVFLHLDGTALDLKIESDDGTTENAATDTTIDAVDDTYFDFLIDGRDLTDIKVYVDGVDVGALAAKTLKLDHATGPLKLLVHMEKTSDDTAGDVRVSDLWLQTFDIE